MSHWTWNSHTDPLNSRCLPLSNFSHCWGNRPAPLLPAFMSVPGFELRFLGLHDRHVTDNSISTVMLFTGFFFLLETGCHYISLAGLEITIDGVSLELIEIWLSLPPSVLELKATISSLPIVFKRYRTCSFGNVMFNWLLAEHVGFFFLGIMATWRLASLCRCLYRTLLLFPRLARLRGINALRSLLCIH